MSGRLRLVKDTSGECARCSQWRPRLNRDHIIPRFRGGQNTPENIQFLCANCHEDKTDAERRSYRHSAERREKMRLAVRSPHARGYKLSAATRAKMSATRTGMLKSPEARARMSAIARMKRRTPRGTFAEAAS